ncbi:helix-turn-helix transcriptional regulator [Kitasatospora kifunensis]|uniref:DNA-binding CsgD family transcriptional regulator n=1 Tax=Kitasatospora kifunensis TaxID=58351 RepID=A0A7W7RAV8_KITKI|nr:helix-turn-helix transcriptional regulator [Kitasatospora kifunensis]MBB4927956.1 DNA-binding CsgD family transcriptional regulator [Kitasatospora kifunensis]
MTLLATSVPISPACVRIAITSPDILAQIRQVFASKNLAVEIVRLPYVEVIVRPAVGVAATDRPAVGSGLARVAGPASRASAPGARRLCAEYRLSVVEVGGRSGAERPAPQSRPYLAAVPDAGADGPVAALSQRQHEVMALVSRGVRNAEIAARLHVSEKTVKNHINRIFRSLGAGSRVEAVLIWQHHQHGGPSTRRGAPNPSLPPAGGRHPEHAGDP